MKKIGLIMEVNPFHNGHKYFLEQVRKENPNEIIIVVISTTVVQRGEVSVLSKNIKTHLLLPFVDLILEMPLIYVNQGGEYFAYYAVKILNDLKVDKIIFGSESNDIKLLNKQASEEEMSLNFKDGYLKNKIKNIKSNDILGISYIKAIKKINPSIEVKLIKRKANNYNDQNLTSSISSATAIRNNYLKVSKKELLKLMPQKSFENIDEFNQSELLNLLKINLLNINEQLIFLSEEGQLINKIKKNIDNKDIKTLGELAIICSDKNNSKYKFQRLFINIILNVTSDFILNDKIISNKYKVLGFNSNIQKYLKNNDNLFFSYKEIEIDKSIYKYNEKIDKLLSIFSNKDLNKLNYQKPIIKDGK